MNRARLMTDLIILLATGDLFLLYERYIGSFAFPLYYPLAIVASIILVDILRTEVNHSALNTLVIPTLVLFYFILKQGFLSAVPNLTLSPYTDSYVVYQVAKSIVTYHHMQPAGYYVSASAMTTMPLVPIFSAITSIVTQFGLFYIQRNIGSIVSGIVLPLALFITYKPLKYSQNMVTWILLLSSPWLLGFLVWGHYAIFSTVFVSILIFTLLKKLDHLNLAVLWFILASAMALTHAYMAIVLMLAILIYAFLLYVYKHIFSFRGISFSRLYIIFAIYGIFVLAYLILGSPLEFSGFLYAVQYSMESLRFGSPLKGIEYYSSGGLRQYSTIATYLIYLGAASLIGVSLASFGKFIHIIIKGPKEDLSYYLLQLSLMVVSIMVTLPFFLYPTQMTDLLLRFFYLWYLGIAPYFGLWYGQLDRTEPRRKARIPRGFLNAGVFFILILGLLLATMPDFQDWNTPIIRGEDIRLNQAEWVAAGTFSEKIPAEKIYGLRRGVSTICLFHRRTYVQIQPSVDSQPLIIPKDFGKLDSILSNSYIFLRKTITKYPETPSYVIDKGSFEMVFYGHRTDVIYSCSDVILLMTLARR